MPRDRLPPMNRVPVNTAGVRYFELEEYGVHSWGELPDGKGPATQVHLVLSVKGANAPLVMRFKSPAALDLFIASLSRHRFDVWPGKDAP